MITKEAEETLEQFLHRAKNTQDKMGYHLLRGDYARAIGDTEMEEQERLLSEQLKTQLVNKISVYSIRKIIYQK